MFNIPPPEMQIDFSLVLSEIRDIYLQDALAKTIIKLDITEIDKSLAHYVPPESLKILAMHGLRAELMFPIPMILEDNPKLLGYYRLLYGYSQKEFYTKKTGVSKFQSMEKNGRLTPDNAVNLGNLCKALSNSGNILLNGIGSRRISKDLLDDLTLLTLGPQLRGGANVRKGAEGIVKVFEAIHKIVKPAVQEATNNYIKLKNAAGRVVLIQFAADPDIIIREEMSTNNYRELIAVEVKAGSDFSNIHNRLGEAEKSHQKAKAAGYSECWTVINVDRTDIELAKRESPSTNRFYRISDLVSGTGIEYQDFHSRVLSLTGIPS